MSQESNTLYAKLRLLTRDQLRERAEIYEPGWGRQQLIATIIMKEVHNAGRPEQQVRQARFDS